MTGWWPIVYSQSTVIRALIQSKANVRHYYDSLVQLVTLCRKFCAREKHMLANPLERTYSIVGVACHNYMYSRRGSELRLRAARVCPLCACGIRCLSATHAEVLHSEKHFSKLLHLT